MVTGAYKPRNPNASALYQCVRAHFAAFEEAYPTRYQEQYGFYRPIIGGVVEKFLGCGDITKGFARVRCDTCRHEYLRGAKRAWARLIKQVYEVDPLVCPRCGSAMRIIAFIEQPAVIEKILTHLSLWPALSHSPPLASSIAA